MISLLQPWALAALPLVALPLILHLVQRRDPPTVEFPAVRYLVQVTEEHQRRLKLRHWLLLLIRTLLVLALIVAAAGPSAPMGRAASHAPSALVVILDDSPSSGVVVNGTPRLAELIAAARRIFGRATPADALWLVTSTGIPERGTPAQLLQALDRLEPSTGRLDLGQAVTLATEVLAGERRPGSVVVVSDLQASALSAAATGPLVVARPSDPPPPNAGLIGIDPGAQPWTPEGGAVTVRLGGDSGAPVPVTVQLGDRPLRQALVPARGAASFSVGGAAPGWLTLRAEKAPDELRADDVRFSLVRVAPVARASWPADQRYLNAAAEVLVDGGRLARGGDLSIGSLGRGPSVVEPPASAEDVGALNRALARRGVGWNYGALVVAPGVADSGALVGRERIVRRYALVPVRAGAAGVLATAGGAPWIVRDGDVVLLGSRLDPAWTSLPLAPGFMPFFDAVVNRLARGPFAQLEAAPGDPVFMPDVATDVALGDTRWPVEGGAAFHPPAIGQYAIRAGRDTIGGLSVNLDPRESALAPASDAQVRALWPAARVVDLAAAPGAAFGAAGQASLQGPLLWLALLLGLSELLLASGRRTR